LLKVGIAMIAPVIAAFAVLVAAMPNAKAQSDGPEGFRSPSGNIHCQAFKLDDGAALRCDIRSLSNRPPPRPKDCDLDWGQAFEVSDKAQRAARICHGDTVMDEKLPILRYGASFERHGFVCRSEQTGVECRNASRNGFMLSRARQQVF
jgi:hypothetical protein